MPYVCIHQAYYLGYYIIFITVQFYEAQFKKIDTF